MSSGFYIVRVTEVVGNETNGWTGKGELVMNFLKIGSSPVVKIPLAVTFTNKHLNQCYQILPGSKNALSRHLTEHRKAGAFEQSYNNEVKVGGKFRDLGYEIWQ